MLAVKGAKLYQIFLFLANGTQLPQSTGLWFTFLYTMISPLNLKIAIPGLHINLCDDLSTGYDRPVCVQDENE